MLRRRYSKNLTAVHESNYAKLERVVPQIQALSGDVKISANAPDQLIEVCILERTKYTTALRLSLKHANASRWLPEICMHIRTYHDARVAEALSFQHHARFDSKYDYPNPSMYHRNEKQQINRFLSEWLDHCLKSQVIFDGEVEPIGV